MIEEIKTPLDDFTHLHELSDPKRVAMGRIFIEVHGVSEIGLHLTKLVQIVLGGHVQPTFARYAIREQSQSTTKTLFSLPFSPPLRLFRFKVCSCEQFCALPSCGYSSVFPTRTLSNVVSKSTTSICVPTQFGVNALTPKSLSGAAAGALSGIE